jgi:tetrahydromethanopterin S-methyltransferase subunit B
MKKLLFILLCFIFTELAIAQTPVTTRRVKTDTLTSLSGNGIDLKDKIVNSTGNIEFDGWLQADSGVTIYGSVQIGITPPDSSVTITEGVHIIGGLKVDGQVALEDSVITLPADTIATRKYAREHGADGYFDSTYVYQEIEKLNTRVDSVIVEVEDLNGRADSLITAINSVNGRADSLITAVESLNTRADSIITAVEDVNTRADSLITAVETLNTRIDSLITGLDNLNTRADSIITGLGSLNARVDSILVTVIPRLDTRIDSVIANFIGFDSTYVYQELDKVNARIDSILANPPSGSAFAWNVSGESQVEDSIRFIAGSNVTLTQSGNTMTIAATAAEEGLFEYNGDGDLQPTVAGTTDTYFELDIEENIRPKL